MITDILLVLWLGYDWKVVLFFIVFPIIMGLIDFFFEWYDPRM